VLQSARADDRPWDRGTALWVTWTESMPEDFVVQVERRDRDGVEIDLGTHALGVGRLLDSTVSTSGAYTYLLTVYDPNGNRVSTTSTGSPVSPRANGFDAGRLGEAVIVAALFALLLWGFYRKRSLYLRPLGGLTAMEDAIGRAVEMGRPVLFSAGWGAQLDKPATMAALNLFGWIARKAATYGARLIFPAHDAVIMAAAQESASEGARLEGRPDWYQSDSIYYVTGSQFGYAAAIDGILWRERPAANFWLGTFAAEALILSEAGHQVGAVQIAGTDSTIQLAFFLVSCDHTLIGEELFAASAYLTSDPKVTGSLWAQDQLKTAAAILIPAALIAGLLGFTAVSDYLRGL
jgi:hypothetical protein